MHWVIQDRMYEDGFDVLKEHLVRFGIPHDIVTVVPFSHELIPEIEPKGLVMACGGTTLSKIAKQRGWLPGTFLNDDHDYRQWERHYGTELLNAGMTVSRFADVVPQEKPFFIRPCTDGKAFTGMVTDWPTFEEWQNRVVNLHEQDTSAYMSLDGDTMVAYGPVRTIYREYRFFIVDGRAVTQSVYKVGSRILYNADVEDEAIAYANRIAAMWGPARAYCLDICLTEDGYRVLEINCINSAGFYAIDIQKFVNAIERMEFAMIPPSSLPSVCDGKEQHAFEEWAKSEGMDMTEHPLHYLFMDKSTDAARQAWKAAINYVRAVSGKSLVTIKPRD